MGTMNFIRRVFLSWLFAFFVSVFVSPEALSVEKIKVAGSTNRIKVADVAGDGAKDLVYGTYDGDIACQDIKSGKVLWKYRINGFPFGLEVADVNRDGKMETFAACGDGNLYAFSADGKLLWKYAVGYPLYAVSAGDIVPGGNLEIVTSGMDINVHLLSSGGKVLDKYEFPITVPVLVAGNFREKDRACIFAAYTRGQTQLLVWSDKGNGRKGLKKLWGKKFGIGELEWKYPAGTLKTFYPWIGAKGDVNGDGLDDILLGSSTRGLNGVLCADGNGKLLFRTKPLKSHIPFTQPAVMTFPAVIDLLKDSPGREVLALNTNKLNILSSKGEILKQYHNMGMAFSDICVDESAGLVYLGTNPNGGDTVYVLKADEGIKGLGRQFTSIKRSGHAKKVADNLAELRKLTLAYKGDSYSDRTVYYIQAGSSSARALKNLDRAIDLYKKRFAWFREQLPYKNIVPYLVVTVNEKERKNADGVTVGYDNFRGHKAASQEDILKLARAFEKNAIHVRFEICHGNHPKFTLDTAKKILGAAPRYCIGFAGGEDSRYDWLDDPKTRCYGWMIYWKKLLDICRENNVDVLMYEKGAFWMDVPAMRKGYDVLLADDRGHAMVPSMEQGNSRSHELSFYCRAGLWFSGLVKKFSCRVQPMDFGLNFNWVSAHLMHSGHAYFRKFAVNAVAGASEFEAGYSLFNSRTLKFYDYANESMILFLHMLGKGVIVPPKPNEVVNFNSTGIATCEPARAHIEDGTYWSPWSRALWKERAHGDGVKDGLFPMHGGIWSMTTLPDTALAYHLMGKRRQAHAEIPQDPYGLVLMVPSYMGLTGVKSVKKWWYTDGVDIWEKGGKKMRGRAAVDAVKADFEKAAKDLPFTAEGDVYLQANRLGEDKYRLYLIDPGYLNPKDRKVKLNIRKSGLKKLRDILTGEEIPVSGGSAEIIVPAGIMRVLEAEFSEGAFLGIF